MKIITKQGKTVNLLAKGTCLACELDLPHKVKQNEWCKVKEAETAKT